jgi:hypothetical protein
VILERLAVKECWLDRGLQAHVSGAQFRLSCAMANLVKTNGNWANTTGAVFWLERAVKNGDPRATEMHQQIIEGSIKKKCICFPKVPLAELYCNRCKSVAYCSIDCQKASSKDHRKYCKEIKKCMRHLEGLIEVACGFCKTINPPSRCTRCKVAYFDKQCQVMHHYLLGTKCKKPEAVSPDADMRAVYVRVLAVITDHATPVPLKRSSF